MRPRRLTAGAICRFLRPFSIAMRKLPVKALLLISSLSSLALAVSAPASAASMNHAQASAARYTRSMCHQKIDPKNLTGQAKRDAWKACKESPDSYN